MWHDRFEQDRKRLGLASTAPVRYDVNDDQVKAADQKFVDLGVDLTQLFGPLVHGLVAAAREGKLVVPSDCVGRWNAFAIRANEVAIEHEIQWLRGVPKVRLENGKVDF